MEHQCLSLEEGKKSYNRPSIPHVRSLQPNPHVDLVQDILVMKTISNGCRGNVVQFVYDTRVLDWNLECVGSNHKFGLGWSRPLIDLHVESRPTRQLLFLDFEIRSFLAVCKQDNE